jgi:hypothetical protein
MNDTDKTLATLVIAGTKHHGATQHLASLKPGTPLRLFREGTNPHDKFAIAIIFIDNAGQEHKLGYVPATNSQLFSTLIDNNIPISCTVAKIIATSYNPILINLSLA